MENTSVLSLSVSSWVHLNNSIAVKNGNALQQQTVALAQDPAELYRALQCSYMKFFKMDMTCKWAWLGAEIALQDNEIADKSKVAVVLQTNHGSMDVDKKYLASKEEGAASPALFVYTLPNIMLGEISIRHGFKGEQLCMASKLFNPIELEFWVGDLLNNRGMEACLCGWVDVYGEQKDICLFWVTKQENGTPFTVATLNELYKQ